MMQRAGDRSLPVLHQPHERRSGRRLEVYSKQVRVNHLGQMGAACCENISDRGMRLRLTSCLDVSDAVVVIFTHETWISGRVAWQRKGHCGIAFDQPIDSPLFLYHVAGLHSGPLAEVSGKRLLPPADHRFREGLHVRVALPSGGERHGVIHWGADQCASLEILEG